MGYYPTSQPVVEAINRRLDFGDRSDSILIDPCCGTGEVADIYRCDRLGIELDMGRAMAAERRMDKVLNADAFTVKVSPELASVLYLNPPYNQVKGGKRLEYYFLTEFLKSLRTDGILIYIIQRQYLQGHIATTLASHFHTMNVRAYPETGFDQVILFGIKRATSVPPDPQIVKDLKDQAQSKELKILEKWNESFEYLVPERLERYNNTTDEKSGDSKINYDFFAKTTDFKKVLEEVENSGACAALERFLYVKTNDKISANPPMPFKEGHSALLAVSGYLDGVVGEGANRHIVKARAIKTQSEKIETNEDGVTEKVMRDMFQIEAKVLLPDGTIRVLSRSKVEDEDEVVEVTEDEDEDNDEDEDEISA